MEQFFVMETYQFFFMETDQLFVMETDQFFVMQTDHFFVEAGQDQHCGEERSASQALELPRVRGGRPLLSHNPNSCSYFCIFPR